MPIVSQIGFTADQGHFAGFQLGHLVDKVEGLSGGQLFGPERACAGTAVQTAQVALQGDFPHHIQGVGRVVVTFSGGADKPRGISAGVTAHAGLGLFAGVGALAASAGMAP